jgi:uncharacterized protein
MDVLLYLLAGATVGLAVGMTGVGGGSLMTPMLLGFGFPLHIAVGTDLLFAAITKSGGAIVHMMQRSVRWDLVLLMAAGSIPATVVMIVLLKYAFDSPDEYRSVLTTTLGFALILTSAAILYRHRLAEFAMRSRHLRDGQLGRATPVFGAILGVFVTLSSVGAGAIAAAVLMIVYPRLKSVNVVGTDIAHAVPLTLVAGLGHYYLGNVDVLLLLALLAGSLPAVWVGSRLARFIPEHVMRPVLATMLCGIGIKFAFF